MRVPSLTPRGYRRVALGTLVMLALIIVSGAVVRLTNSGLGCDKWPQCNPSRFIGLTTKNQRIEQINRIFSGLIVVPIVMCLVAALRLVPRQRKLVRYGWTLLGLYFCEAVLGGIVVKVKLAWVSVMGHFLLALALGAVALLNFHAAARLDSNFDSRDAPPTAQVATRLRLLARVIWCGLTVAIILGTLVTASGPHGGDKAARRLAWGLENITRVHSVTVDVVLALVVVLGVALWRARAPRAVTQALGALLVAMCIQATIGYVQWFQQIPPLLVGFHVAGATFVFLAATELQIRLGS